MLPQIIFAKTYPLHREHFIQRLKLRYNIDLSTEQYDILCSGAYINKNFEGKFSKGSHKKTVGIIKINSLDIPVLYNSYVKSLDTCYSPDTFSDIDKLIGATIVGPMRGMARKLYNQIIETCQLEYRDDFQDAHEAGKYFFVHSDCTFPDLLIAKFKHGDWDLVRVVRLIARLLYAEHEKYELVLTIKNKTMFQFFKHKKENQVITAQCLNKLPKEEKKNFYPTTASQATHEAQDDGTGNFVLNMLIVSEMMAGSSNNEAAAIDSPSTDFGGGSGGGGGAEDSYADNTTSVDTSSADIGSNFDSGSSFDSGGGSDFSSGGSDL